MGNLIDPKKDNKIQEYILKHNKKREKELKYDFMPSLLEIIECPAHIGGKVIIYGIFSLLLITILWSCFSKIDIVVVGSGLTKPADDVKTIQAALTGTIKRIHVKEGQKVETGDLLIELDYDEIKVDETQINEKLKTCILQKELYMRIQKGEDIASISLDQYEEKQKPFVSTIIESENAYQLQLESLNLQKKNDKLDLKLAKLTRQRYANSAYDSDIRYQDIIVEQKELLVEQAEAAIENAKIQHESQILDQIMSLSELIDQLNAQLQISKLQEEGRKITAPTDGIVTGIEVNTIGGVVTTSQVLLTMIPSETPFEMECLVENKDISNIEIGDAASVKLDAYPYTKYGTIEGKVKSISSNSYAKEQLGNVYIVTVELLNSPNNNQLISGLSGRIEIKIGKRSIMTYFLDPIRKGFGESLKEK